MVEEPTVGNLVATASGEVGLIKDVAAELVVKFDSGQTIEFPLDSDEIDALVLAEGTQVELVQSSQIGTVVGSLEVNGRRSYFVNLPNGLAQTVLEDGLRPAAAEEPIALLRDGRLDDARSVNLRISAIKLAYSNEFDELSSLSNSRVEIKPHQVGVVHRVMSAWPHRFILADEVGLGKTIEAGLIIKELKARGLANRVLILAPAGLVSQWQFEMKTKFNEIFSQYDGPVLKYIKSQGKTDNPWTANNNVIASTGFATAGEQQGRPEEIARAGWDLVVIDEAHHARRTRQGQSKRGSTRLYKLAEALNDPRLGGASSCLLLTATPMQLDPYELYSMVELLDPTLFPGEQEFEQHRREVAGLNALVERLGRWDGLSAQQKETVEEELRESAVDTDTDLAAQLSDPASRNAVKEKVLARHRLSQVMVRNRKSVIGGFQPRVASPWPVHLTPKEQAAYDAVTEYVRTGFDRARAEQSQAIGFLMTTFQKLLASSSRAVTATMIKRIEKLEREGAVEAPNTTTLDDEDLDERDVREALDPLLGIGAYEAVSEECQELEMLVGMLDAIEHDSKALVLRDRLAKDIAAQDPDAKVLIFTEYRNTQEYLKEVLESTGWNVNLFHGSLKKDEKDQAVERFRDGTGLQVMITTPAGGEGRNFQFCHTMVNYDLPWNPMKVEQRIGRIDRIGQRHPVKIVNLFVEGTVEERVVSVLANRIKLFEETVGGLDPILGRVERDLKDMLAMADAEQAKQLEEFELQLESRVHQAREAERLRADFIMDMSSYRRDEVGDLLERRSDTTNEDLQAFCINALRQLECRVKPDPAAPGIFQLDLSERAELLFPKYAAEGRRRRVAFDPAVALEHEEVEFFAFGHELVDGLVNRVRERGYPARTAVRRVLSSDLEPIQGWHFVYGVELDGVLRSRELLPVFVDIDGVRRDDVAEKLLRISYENRPETFGEPALPPRREVFEQAAATAGTAAVERMIERQAELTAANQVRLEAEREKRERFYEYKGKAAREKLARTEATFEQVSASDDPSVARIVPVWAKNVENAKRMVTDLDDEKARRLKELETGAQVSAQHSIIAATYVEVLPDPGSLPGIEGGRIKWEIRKRAAPASAQELTARINDVAGRAKQLKELSRVRPFKLEDVIGCARGLIAMLKVADRFDAGERFMLQGAVEYFLAVDDGIHDLGTEDGFRDDLQVMDALAQRLGVEY